MSDVSAPRATTPAVPVVSPRELLPYAVFAGTLLLLAVYFAGAQHDLVHDARHLLGFPCH